MSGNVMKLIETGLLNEGRQSVIDASMGPGNTTFPHYHTQFSETFEVLSGSMTVMSAPEGNKDPEAMAPRVLNAGDSATIPKFTAHNFVVGKEGCRLLTKFEPAALNFERVALIMPGIERDAAYEGHGDGANDGNATFLSVLTELTDSHPILDRDVAGLVKVPKETTDALTRRLIEKYATDGMIISEVKKNNLASE